MSTTDLLRSPIEPVDRLEAALFDLFAVQPHAAALDRLDERIDRRLRSWTPRSAGAARVARLRPGRRAGVIGLLAAAFVIAGANGSLKGLYFFLAGPFDTPWHRGVEVNQSQVVDGYRVTIDRAYADATRLALAISVVDEFERPGTTQIMAFSTVVTDEAGEYSSGGGAVSSPDGAFAAVNVAWKTPAMLPLPSGTRTIHVELPFIMVRDDSIPPPNADEADATAWDPWHRVAGPWTFDFEIIVDGGTAITPDVVTEVDGLGVRVTRVIAASSVVRVEMQVEGGQPGDQWWPHGEIRHRGEVLTVVTSSIEDDGSFVLMTGGGVRDASGEWTITITELDRGDTRLVGPWVLRFDAP